MPGLDVAGAAHRGRVGQAGGHQLDDLDHGRAARRGVRGRPAHQQRKRQRRGGPGPVMLGGEIAAAGLAQIGVDQFRVHRARLAVLVQVMEQLLPGQVQAALDHARDAAVAYGDIVRHAALAGEAQAQPAALQPGMAARDGGQAERAVLARVRAAADPRQRGFEQAHHRGGDLVRRQAAAGQVARHAAPDARQGAAELAQLAVLGRVAPGPPVGVVAVLLAAAGVAPGGLQMAVGPRADPHFAIGGRNGQRRDARQRARIAHPAAVRIVVGELSVG
ncbi:hypothetical protein KM22_02772 [Bordetella bronchiseptica KM22]|nr:hypothetical protein KM22_02772 [Bordetella bronchiseptica KM22]